MSPEAFIAWQALTGLSGIEAARRLGKTPHTIVRWRQHGIPPGEAPAIALAMSAVAKGLEPWPR